MASPAHRGKVYRFGIFEVFAETRELLRQGRKIKLQEQPFQLLLLLLESPGEIVEREFLLQRLWPENTFVEFTQSLGTAVTKLRQALGDDAANPRFVETIPKRGYRFIAPVSHIADTPAPEAVGDAPAPAVFQKASDERAAQDRSASPAERGRKWLWPAVIALVLAAVATIYLFRRNSSFVLAAKDTIVLADFENTTGETVFNDALRQGLMVGLAQSPIIHVLSDRNAALIVRQMGRYPEDRVTGRLAVELCRRVGGKVAVQGSISSLGTTYLIGLAAIRCDTSKPIAHEQVEASQREDVIDALGKATSRLRAHLGESLPSVQKYNAPLEQATTSSLEALNAYGTALSTWDAKGDNASIPYFKKAIALDPNFAMAYGGLAAIYHNIGEAQLASENTTKAYRLRDRVTESERASIDARYYLYVTEELDKAAQTYENLAAEYPESAGSFNHLGTIDLKLGRNEQAAASFRKAILLDPTRSNTYANLAVSSLRLNRMQDAASALEAAEKRGFQTEYLIQVNYWMAFLHGDRDGMARVAADTSKTADAKSLMLSEQANTEAYYGHFEKARTLSKAAAQQMQQAGDKESAALCLAQAAIREAQAGSAAQARTLIEQARKIDDDREVTILTALVAAEIGDLQQALALSETINKRYPNATLIQNYWLPILQAHIELQRGRAAEAVALLAKAEPYDAAVTDELPTASLYGAYLRGMAYLSAGDGQKAGEEFQKLIDHPAMAMNYSYAAQARLGRARAYALAGRFSDAGNAYQEFLKLWHDADPDISILRQAHSEFDRLKTTH
jgi:DNA-binding winged helix-turn-helix (wHTH) protein/tetratricopeptide (TPR) repeat protein